MDDVAIQGLLATVSRDLEKVEAELAELRAVKSYLERKLRDANPGSNGSTPDTNGADSEDSQSGTAEAVVKVPPEKIKGKTRFEACEIILKHAGKAMKTPDIARAMKQAGMDTNMGDAPLASALFTAMSRKQTTFKKAGRGEWELVACGRNGEHTQLAAGT